MEPTLTISPAMYGELLEHLASSANEQVAFLYADGPDSSAPIATELYKVPPEGFAGQSAFHLALSDEVRGHVIARAWKIGGALVEIHSHPGASFAGFSPTDLVGFGEWVPHVRWRLQGATYIALVFAGEEFDALIWSDSGEKPGALAGLHVGDETLMPSNITLRHARLP